MTTPFDTLPPTNAVLHAVPSTFADIERVAVPVLFGLVDPLSLLLPQAVETSSADIAINTRILIDRSLGVAIRAAVYIAWLRRENRHATTPDAEMRCILPA